jgi:hypothetical protein
MVKTFRIAAITMLIAGPVQAQSLPPINLLSEAPEKSAEQKARDAELDRDYKESLKKIPDGKVSNDPWGAVRSDTPRAPAKTQGTSAAKTGAPKTGTVGVKSTAATATPAKPSGY